MNHPVFKREDFVLCNVPVPKGYPQSQTHIGVAQYEGKTYLTSSPYPGPVYGKWEGRFRHLLRIVSFGKMCNPKDGEYYENPCLYIGSNMVGFAPTKFSLMNSNALMDTPESFFGLPSYNSDPDIFIDNDIICVLNRSVIRTKTYNDGRSYAFKTRLYLLKGVNENGHFKLLSNHLVKESDGNYVSPAIEIMQGRYIVVYLDNCFVGHELRFKGLYMTQSDSIEDAFLRESNNKKIELDTTRMIPWHISIFQFEDVLYAIVTCLKRGDASLKMWQMLGRFDKDLTKLEIFDTPLTDYNSYRGSAFVNEQGVFVLYTPTVHERISGSSSVDGRDVLKAEMMFSDVLCKIDR